MISRAYLIKAESSGIRLRHSQIENITNFDSFKGRGYTGSLFELSARSGCADLSLSRLLRHCSESQPYI